MTGSSETTRQDVVCILGMGRSGTSLIARVSNLLGLYLGPQHFLLQPNAGNPKGYWENSEIVDINDAILRHFGGTWDEPPIFPVGWEQDSSLDELRQRAYSSIENTYGRVKLWGWKDPRNCLTLPFWQQLLPEMRYVICLRNPLSVAHSLKHLFDFTTDKSSNLWLTYVRSSLAHSQGKSRLIVFYQDIIENWLMELRRLAYFLGQPDRAEQLFIQEAVRGFIENDLQHYRSSTNELTNDSKISKSATELYLAHRGHARARQTKGGGESAGVIEDPSGRLEFTGERFVPSVNGQIKYEHLHRYALALDSAAGKSVLDIASGEGYGAALLARVAHSVIGVDIDPAVVSHSRNTYYSPNLNFIAGSCESIPLANASVDLVTSFETIEHHDQHEQMMLEIKRVLRPGGCLVISSPNRQTYSRDQKHANPFHAKELDYHELQELLSRHFKHVQVHGQRLATGSFVTPVSGVSGGEFGFYTGDASELRRQIASLPAPVYFVAVCSDQAIAEWAVDSIYLDPKDELFESLEKERLRLLHALSYAHSKYAEENLRAQEYQRHLEREIEKRAQHQTQLESELEKNLKYQKSLLDELDKHRQYQKTLTDEIDKHRQYQKALTDEIDKHREYQKGLAGEIDKHKQYQAVLEEQASSRAQTIETLTAGEHLAREQLEIQSDHLGKLNQSMSEMRERISDLEGLLTKHYDEAREKQAELLASEEQVRESTQLAAVLEQRSQRRKELLALMSAGDTESQTEPAASTWSGRFRRRNSRSSKQIWSGDLDTPKEELIVGSVLEIAGSVRSEAAPVSLAGAFLDKVPLGLLDHKAVSNPESPALPDFGFAGRFSLGEFPPGRRTLQVRVIDEQHNIKDFYRTVVINQKESDQVGPGGNACLAANPDQVPVGKVVGVTNLTWDTGDGSYGEVYVSVNGEPETLFSSGPSGSQTAPWIVGGSSYKFCLYAGNQRERLLKEATAFGTIVPATESRDALRELQNLSTSKKALLTFAEMALRSFLTSKSVVEFRPADEPEVSIVLVLYNRAELTLQCLYSILRSDLNSYEVVIVDNASTDETPELLQRIKGARVIRNDTNLHFLRACNQAVKLARGENLLLLNNDAQLMPGSISSALRTLHSSNDIGAVGGKIILADGTLQEAGSIIWQDGSCLGFGRGDSPLAPPYMYQRDVDYCSAAFLLTPRELFLSAGGFDEAFAPAYYEEVDYCVGLWEQGKRVVYDPNSIIVHYEFGSSTSQSSAIDLQIANRETFVKKRGDWLRSQHAAPSDPLLAAHRLRVNRRRILFLDDRVPHTFLGAGFPRSNRMLSELSNLGCAVTFYPTTCPREQWEDVYRDTSPEVEVMLDHGGEKLKEFLRQRRDYYDAILISRPHNMAMFKEAVGDEPGLLNGARVIYDAEALFAYREIRKSAVAGQPLSEIEQENLIAEEVRLAENCDYVVSVSDRERDEFARHGCEHAFTLGHTVEVTPTEKKFEARQDLLFVGAIHSLSSPNADSMIWFVHEILPLIQQRLGDIKLTIAGLSCADFQRRVRSGSVELVGKVDDLSPLYDRARVFVAPTRFSAGIPIKICDAAAHGLPTVTTNLSGYQLGWSDERELLLADDPESFADACVKLYNDPLLWSRLRENAIERVGQDFSPKTFLEQLRQILP